MASQIDPEDKIIALLLADGVRVGQLTPESHLEEFADAVERLHTEVLDRSGSMRAGVLGMLDGIDLATHRSAEVAHDLKLGMMILLNSIIESALKALPEDAGIQISREVEKRLSESARRAADCSHRHNREMRAAALADWEAEGHKFSSMRAFARESFKKYGVRDFMTVYNWLRKHRKANA